MHPWFKGYGHFTEVVDFAYCHCEILGSYLQQYHQHNIFRAHFYAEPQSQAQEKKEDRLYSNYSRSKLTVSRVTDNSALLCYARYVHVNGGETDIFDLVWLLRRHFMIFFSLRGITGCGSTSLKLCVSNAASPWSKSGGGSAPAACAQARLFSEYTIVF